MIDQARQNIKTVGELLRYITPILIGALGWLTIDKLDAIDKAQGSQAVQLSVISEKVTRLESLERDVRRLEGAVGRHDSRIREIEINDHDHEKAR